MSPVNHPSHSAAPAPAATGDSFLRALVNTLLGIVLLVSVALLLAWVGMAT